MSDTRAPAPPRVLLFGRAGQVGGEVQRLLEGRAEVVAPPESQPDFRDADALRSAVRAAQPTVIINAAAYTAVDRAESEPDVAHAVNAVAPGVLAEEGARLGALFIHYSTDYVFDGTKRAPYVETDIAAPLGEYGRSKLEGERRVLAAGGRSVILRTRWVYGPRGSNFLLTMLRLFAERDEVRVVDDQVGAPTSARKAQWAEGVQKLTSSKSGCPARYSYQPWSVIATVPNIVAADSSTASTIGRGC